MILVEYEVMNYTVNEMCSEWTLWFITRDVAHSFAYVTQTLQILTPYFSYSGIDKTADWEEEIEGTVHTRHFPYYSYEPDTILHFDPLLKDREGHKTLQAEFTILRTLCTLPYLEKNFLLHGNVDSYLEVVWRNPAILQWTFSVNSARY